MIVISDTSPLITLAKIGHIHLLQTLFGSVIVPSVVLQELSAKSAPDILLLTGDWLIVRAPSTPLTFPGLDAGEVAAISLAVELSESSLLIDERAGRKTASSAGISVIGTVGVLIEAAERGLVELQDTFERLKKTDFRFPAKALDDLLEAFHRRRTAQGFESTPPVPQGEVAGDAE